MTPVGAGSTRDRASQLMRRWFEDMGVFMVWAVVLFMLGSMFLGAIVQSPSMLQWTGTAVHSVESGGIAYYSFYGQQFTLDVTSSWLQADRVYLDPANPSDAMLGNPVVRWTELATVGGPYAAAVLLLTFGFARRSRRRRLRADALGASEHAPPFLDRQRPGAHRDADQANRGDR